jgi:3'-5' exoribonuclease
MEQDIRIADMNVGQQVQGFYVLKDIRCKTTTSGSPFISARLMDATGEMEAKIWNYSGPITEEDSCKVMLIRGEVSEYNGTPQFVIQKICLASADDHYDVKELVPSAPLEENEALAEVREILASIDDGEYRRLCQAMLERHLDAFLMIPAAKSVHHAFRSGLLMHTLNMMRAADFLSQLYFEVIDRSLLLAGTFLHDFGKEREMVRSELGLVTDYSAPGKLLGHLYMCAQEVCELAREQGMSEEKTMLLQHLILSHHGKLEFGAAVEPQCAESELLSIIDLMDSRMEIYAETLADTQPGSFSGKNFGLGKAVYRHT